MEEIHLYKGLCFTLPKEPPKNKIQGYGLPKHKQKWKRTELPENWTEITEEIDFIERELITLEKQLEVKERKMDLSVRDGKSVNRASINPIIKAINEKVSRHNELNAIVEKFALEEDRKCTEGIWFYNNGVATYITGDHYHYLNWFKLDGIYADFRDRDKRWFYHWYLCDINVDCLGQDYGKLRRDGYSFRVMSIIYNRARKSFDSKFGLMSKSVKDTNEMFNKGVNAFSNYPSFFKPQVYTAEDPKDKIIFKTPQQRVTYKTRTARKEISLNTEIESFAPNENAMDGSKRKIIAGDEVGKFPKDVSVEKWFNVAKRCCYLGSTIIGKILFGSTVNEALKGGEQFENIWKLSDHNQKTKNGRTVSGLWRYFADAADGMEGFVDEFGMSVILTPEMPVMGINGEWIHIGAAEYIANELEGLKKAGDMVGYYEFKRQFPREESDMFINPANEITCWDINKIHQQLEHNKIVSIDRTIVHGYFTWANGIRDCGVVCWNPVEKDNLMAKHKFVWFPEIGDRNKLTMLNGKKAPGSSHIGLFTLDPYSAVNTVDNRQSKAASHGFKKFDFTAPKHLSEVYIGEYWNRLSDPLLVYEDMIMQSVFFGWPLIPERNIKNCNDYFRNRDYHNFLLQAPNMTAEEYFQNKDKVQDAGLANTGGKTQQQLVEYQASYISNKVGVNDVTGEMGYMPFDNTLKDWLIFDIKKWTPFDLTVSSMLAPTTARGFVPKKKVNKLMNLFPQYRLNGDVSERI